MKERGALGKFWYLLWEDDSLKGWIFSLLFLFIFIKFIFLPGLSFVTGTELPMAIVESCSMYHKHNLFYDFEDWWQAHEDKYEKLTINDLDFKSFFFSNGFNKGDILFIIKANPEKLEVGDIIIFEAGQQNPLIHRIINIEKNPETGEKTFSTIGDNNNAQLSVEKSITEDQLVGKAVFKIAPYIGWGKLVFYEFSRPENERGLCNQN